MAKVFIGIPTLNRPQLVREAVQSVLNQTFGDYTLVVSDNRSEPEAVESVRCYIDALGDPRVRFCLQPENAGEYGQGRFFFSEAAEHDYFMILHDDDVLNADYLEKAVAVLDLRPEYAFFVANPFLMDVRGERNDRWTSDYLFDHGRKTIVYGEIDTLYTHMMYGFTPISGTLFRRDALRASGFVDEDCSGNFPFECNIFLRLGEHGAKAWFSSEELLGFRFHPDSLRNYLKLMDNRHVVNTMILLFSRRRFRGAIEKRRRTILSRLYRARALIALRDGDRAACRTDIVRALRENAASLKAWFIAPAAMLVPALATKLLPPLPEIRQAPAASSARGSSES